MLGAGFRSFRALLLPAMDTKLASLACRPEPDEDFSVRTDSVATRLEDAVLSFVHRIPFYSVLTAVAARAGRL